MTLRIHCTWSTAIYKYQELFMKSEDDDGAPLSMNHPKVHTFVNHCLDNGMSRNSMPRGRIDIQLPEKVHLLPDTYKVEAVAIRDTNIHIRFSAQPKSVVIETAYRSIVFK
ncbi:hypothetical protein Bhyg_02974 [Pseudolycoriella hygida]|uniref:Uncharacterized protein n=1 Tax=Pseudolycoriella hygida TaxID=35572 RepID=A0A9Q0NDM4_9DIPT|nr:hypothetical protein Bhyg_02974 [Pseudolycoriella hygida]